MTLESKLRPLLAQYASLYWRNGTETGGKCAIRIHVYARRTWPVPRKRYVVTVNDRVRFEPDRREAVLPFVEWAINWEIPRVRPEYLQLHASSMEVDGMGVCFPGDSGSGKSTLTAGLMTYGWRYLCDEFALIHADTLELHPYPRAICIKKPSFPVIESLGLRLAGERHYVKGFKGDVGFIVPSDLGPDTTGRVCPIRYVIFPSYRADAAPLLTPISRAEAVFDLHRVCFNLFGCRRLGVEVLTRMIRDASCYRLTAGELHKTCDLVRGLVEGNRSDRRIRAARRGVA